MAREIIIPVARYGKLDEKYGINITQYNTYPNTTGFPAGAGLELGQFGLLFDGTEVRLLKAAGTIANKDAVTIEIGNSNDYNVIITPTTVDTPVHAANDRLGAALVSDDVVWMTTRGIASVNCAASITAPQFLTNSTAVTGRLMTSVAGTHRQDNLHLLNTTTTAGAYPVFFR